MMVRQEVQRRLKDDSVIWRWTALKYFFAGKGRAVQVALVLLFHLWHCINWESTIYYLTAPRTNSVKWRVIHKTFDVGENKFRQRQKGKKAIEKYIFIYDMIVRQDCPIRPTGLKVDVYLRALTNVPLHLKFLETSVQKGCCDLNRF